MIAHSVILFLGPHRKYRNVGVLSSLPSAGVNYFVLVIYLLLAIWKLLWLPRVPGIKIVSGYPSAACSVKKKHGGC